MRTEKKSTIVSEDLLAELSCRLSSQIGIFFPPDQLHVLEKKLGLALHDLGFKDLHELAESFFQRELSPRQIEVLAKHLTIGETYFFRDKQLFSMLREEIFPEIIRRRRLGEKRIRVWSAACATGEEPYSIAILLNEMVPRHEGWAIEIIASDINPAFLKKAKEARYKSWSFRSMSKEVVERYFHQEGNGEFALAPSIASLVEFHQVNLIGGAYGPLNPFFSGFDLILCNNVLIYFSKEQVDATIKRLVGSLADEGWFSVSAVEVPFVSHTHLASVSSHQITVFRKTDGKRSALPPVPLKNKKGAEVKREVPLGKSRPSREPAALPCKCEANDPKEFYESCRSLYNQGLYTEVALQLANALKVHLKAINSLKSHLKELRLLIHALANQGKLREALEWCQIALQAEKMDPEIHYLHATLLQEMKEEEKAMLALRSALYLNPNMIAAHFSIGLIQLKNKEISSGKRQLKNAIRLLQKMSGDELVPGMENVMAKELIATIDRLEKEIAHLYESR
ncbi:CheR family methyltransferase [Estrella lausannensis]|nr:CheR family methyltransferase [Estrella lausannensis]